METVYTTIENQIRSDGSRGLLYDHYDTEEEAQAKYFTILAAAATSGIPFHEAFILVTGGGMDNVLEHREFDRREDKTPVYTTVENQLREDGSKGLLYDHFDSLEAAQSKYFLVLSAAAISGIPYHEAYILITGGGVNNVLEHRAFDRRVEEEPVEEESAEEEPTE